MPMPRSSWAPGPHGERFSAAHTTNVVQHGDSACARSSARERKSNRARSALVADFADYETALLLDQPLHLTVRKTDDCSQESPTEPRRNDCDHDSTRSTDIAARWLLVESGHGSPGNGRDSREPHEDRRRAPARLRQISSSGPLKYRIAPFRHVVGRSRSSRATCPDVAFCNEH